MVGVGVAEIPYRLLDQLAVGGRIVMPLGDAEGQLLVHLRKRADGLDSETIGAGRFAMLAGERATPSVFPWSRPLEP